MIINKDSYKATIFYEKNIYGEDNPYLKLEMDINDYDGKVTKCHCEIHKIDLLNLNIFSEHFNYYDQQYQIKFNLLPSNENKKIITYTDIIPIKEMTLKEIEEKLGYKIKIKS